MIVRRLSLTDFRNYESAELELVPGANLFVGSNGQGKTNLVESLVYLSTLGSHRVSSDRMLIRQGAEQAVIRALLEHGGRQLVVELQLMRQGANKALLGRASIRVRELPRYVSTILFAPEDLALVRGEPSGRRRFLDELLVLRIPRLASLLADYDRVVRQRNTLLKSARGHGESPSTLQLWDDKLVALGAEIIEHRARLIDELSPKTAAAYLSIAGADHHAELFPVLSVFGADSEEEDAPDPSVGVPERGEIEEAFRAALERLRRAERERAVTLVGPHRDDVLFQLNGMPARTTASHGESWSFALALKLASAELLRAESPLGDPIVILDDVFAELDETRRERLASAVSGFEQVLITAAVRGDVPVELATTVVTITAGVLSASGEPADESDSLLADQGRIEQSRIEQGGGDHGR